MATTMPPFMSAVPGAVRLAVAHGQRPLAGGAGRPHGVVVAGDQRPRPVAVEQVPVVVALRRAEALDQRRPAAAAGRRPAPARRAAPGSRRRAARASRARRGRRSTPARAAREAVEAARRQRRRARRRGPRRAASRSTHCAVIGAIVIPSMAWPAAMMTRSFAGARPTIGIPSARDRAGPAPDRGRRRSGEAVEPLGAGPRDRVDAPVVDGVGIGAELEGAGQPHAALERRRHDAGSRPGRWAAAAPGRPAYSTW